MNSVWQFWREGLEILLLAVGVYYVWKLFHGTRGAKVLVGLATLLVSLALLAVALRLTVIGWILGHSSTFLVLALVILFQPELRRMLAEIGTRHLRGSGFRQWQTEVIEEVVSSIETLQQSHCGALIALERDTVYQPGRETGTLLDAEVSADLLTTIFFPKTPLHDGGVLIAGDRIAAAGAIFPLTQSDRLQRALGLRHRAALGLSEDTDAVVVALSEETGLIALACGGHLERPLTPDELRQRLSELILRKQGT